MLAADYTLSDKDKVKVEAGKLVVHAQSVGDGHSKEVHAFLRINAPAAKVFAVITDFPHLPEFMPNLAKVEVLAAQPSGALVNYYLDLPFGVHKRYRLKLDYDTEPLRMRWQKVAWEGLKPEETIVDTQGFWLLESVDEANTQLHYYTYTDPGHVPFGLGWIVDYLTKEAIVELLENTKKRAEQQ